MKDPLGEPFSIRPVIMIVLCRVVPEEESAHLDSGDNQKER